MENTAEFAAVRFTVPCPCFSIPQILPEKFVPRLMVPLPVNASVMFPRPQVPFKFSVDPARALIAALKLVVRDPVSVLVPDTFSIWPPKLIPPNITWLLPCRLIAFGSVISPESCTAAPNAAAAGLMLMVPVPMAAALPTASTPAFTLMPPVHAELLALRMSVPESFLESTKAVPEGRIGLESVSVLPPVTSTPELVLLSMRLLVSVMVSVTRNPCVVLLVEMRIVPEDPSALSLPICRIPPVMSIIVPAAPKLLFVLVSTRAPLLAFVKATAPAVVGPPLRVPVRVNPCTMSETDALFTVKVGPMVWVSALSVILFGSDNPY